MKQLSDKREYTLTEQGTDRYASLEMAQAAALPVVVQALAEAILEGIASGQLVVRREGGQSVVRIASPEAE